MSGPSTNIGRVDRLASQVEYDAMPDACGSPPPILDSTSGYSELSRTVEGKAVIRGTGQILETSEGSSGESEQIPSGRRQGYSSAQLSQPGFPDQEFYNKYLDNCTFIHRYSSSEKQAFMKRLPLVMKHFERFPDNLKAAYYDVMVLYSEDDRSAAEDYCQSLNDLTLDKGKRVKAVLYDVMDFANIKRRMFGSLEMAFERCTFAFVYLTKQFCKCEWSQIASEECLMEAIYNREKRWCVVPVYTVQRTKADFNIPMGLNSLKGVNFYNNDDFYRRGLQTLIGGKIYKREDNEEKLFIEQYQYAVGLEKKLQLEIEEKQQKLREAELRQMSPPSSSEKEKLLKQLNIQSQGDVDSSVFAAESPKADRSSSSYRAESSMSDNSYLGSLKSRGSQGDQSDSHISFSGNTSQGRQDSSFHADVAFSHQSQVPEMNTGQHGKQPMAKGHMSESEKLDVAMGGQSDFDKDGKVIVHHVHTHTHIYTDREPAKSKKKVVNIYGAENVMIGDKNTIVEGGTQESPVASGKDPEMPTNSRKRQDCNRDPSPSMPMASRQSMEGSSRQSIDGHPSLPPSVESYNTTTKETLPSPNDESNIENNITETDEKRVTGNSTRLGSLQTNKKNYITDTTTATTASLPSTIVTSTVKSNVEPNVSSSGDAANISSGDAHNQTMKGMENVPNVTSSTTASPSSNINSEQTTPLTFRTNISGASNISCVSNVEAGSVPAPVTQNIPTKPKRDNPQNHGARRPIIFSNNKTKPQVMAKVMPLQSKQTSTAVGDEFRNNFDSSIDPQDSKAVGQTEQKEVYQSHNTNVKTAIASKTEDEEETEVKQVATVSPLTPADLEPDCSNSTESSLKNCCSLGLTETDQDDQAVSKVLEMGFPEMQIKAALLSLQSRAPGRRHFSVPNLLDEMEKLPKMPESQNQNSDLDTDGPSDAGFVLLNNESSRQDRQTAHQGSNVSTSSASRYNRRRPSSEQSPRSNVHSPSTGSPSTKENKCKIS
ncbi:uncharacterized protein LOC117334322 [Pecten maximus]|uniref:uncharacterized protein LOC117334322 n=1 Tax=Pecten maximus TaxID=6579 RepID=UPI001458761D|nr:uncharacterized protein LOC117334322 [Pecten maximus]